MIAESRERLPMRVLGYCVMPNHFHLVVRPLGDGDLSRWMQRLLTTHVRRYRRHYGSSGHVWQGRFKAFPCQGDGHLLAVLRYVERNALRAGLVARAEDWPHGSLHARARPPGPVPLEPLPEVVDVAAWVDRVNRPMSDPEIAPSGTASPGGRPTARRPGRAVPRRDWAWNRASDRAGVRGIWKKSRMPPSPPEEYCSRAPTSAFPSSARSPRLPVKDALPSTWEDPAKWAVVDAFGADPTSGADSAAAIQAAVDSGASTIFLPGFYRCDRTIVVRGKVRRIVGLGGQMNYGRRDLVNFRVEGGEPSAVSLEHFGHLGGGIEIDTKRTVVLRSMETFTIKGTTRSEGGELFLEDVVGDNFRFRKQRVWARQLNIENEGTHLTNDGGDVWVLGYKTERGGTLVHTLGGGRTEILGGFSYTTTAGGLAPMFVNDNSAVWAYFSEVCYNGDPFATLIKETRRGATKIVGKGEGLTLPYSGVPDRE